MKIDKSTILKFDRPGPRYTSYPTAPEWSPQIQSDTYRTALRQFGQSGKTLSLYIHIPFCETLCYFCACTMNVRKANPKYGDEYLEYLKKEVEFLADAIGPKVKVKQLHWGGGTPSYLTETQMETLYQITAEHFDIDKTGEIAIEIDPRRVTRRKMEVLRRLGFNRISIGVQDFDPTVQKAVNRIQPFEMVKEFHTWCRELKFPSVNYDLIYGLPKQTPQSFNATVRKVIELKPDRIALYSFAYLPWLKKHHNKFSASDLPSNDQKLDIFLSAREQFTQKGYELIAMDHFALHNDELAKAFRDGDLNRNFMGYTVKPADEYIGLGTSAIGFLQNTYFQNYKTIPEYYRFLKQDELPIERGKVLSEDDKIRQWVIRSLMCRFKIDKAEFARAFGSAFDQYFKDEDAHIRYCLAEGLLTQNEKGLQATELGKIFVRNIAMGFDWYLRQAKPQERFSKTV